MRTVQSVSYCVPEEIIVCCYMLLLAAVCYIPVALIALPMFYSSLVYDSHVSLICIYDVLSMFQDAVNF